MIDLGYINENKNLNQCRFRWSVQIIPSFLICVQHQLHVVFPEWQHKNICNVPVVDSVFGTIQVILMQ